MNESARNTGDPAHNSEKLALAMVAAELCYGRGMSQKEAAVEMSTSPASLSRLLKLAHDAGLVRITFHQPANVALGRALQQRLPHLRSVVVGGTSRSEVAGFAANWFEETDGPRDVVVIDGGRTIAAFVEELSLQRYTDLRILPIVSDPASYDFSALENAVRMAAKSSTLRSLRYPQFRGQYLTHLIEEAQVTARTADCVLLSAGPFEPEFTALEFTKHLGLDPSVLQKSFPGARAAVGYSVIDADGNEVLIPQIEERLPKALSHSDLRDLSHSNSTHVVLVAHSPKKAVAVQAALRAGLCNVLIIDEALARSLKQRIDDE